MIDHVEQQKRNSSIDPYPQNSSSGAGWYEAPCCLGIDAVFVDTFGVAVKNSLTIHLAGMSPPFRASNWTDPNDPFCVSSRVVSVLENVWMCV